MATNQYEYDGIPDHVSHVVELQELSQVYDFIATSSVRTYREQTLWIEAGKKLIEIATEIENFYLTPKA